MIQLQYISEKLKDMGYHHKDLEVCSKVKFRKLQDGQGYLFWAQQDIKPLMFWTNVQLIDGGPLELRTLMYWTNVQVIGAH